MRRGSAGPTDISATLATPSDHHRDRLARSGRIRRDQPLGGGDEGHRLLADHAAGHRAAAGTALGCLDPLGGLEAGLLVLDRGAVCGSVWAWASLMPPPPRSSARSRSPGRSRSVSSSSSWVPRPTTAAVLEHEDQVGVDDRGDPLGHDHDGGVPGGRPQRRPQPGVGGEVERGERVVEQVDPRPAYQRPRDGQALALAAGEVGAALGDRRRRAPRPSPRRSRAPGRSRAPPTARPRSRRACRAAGCCAIVPENRYARCGTSPICAQSASGSSWRTSTPPTRTTPGWRRRAGAPG